jgi:hypothetical protein
MQTARYPRKLAKLLDHLLDEPLTVDWDETPKAAWPLKELWLDGKVYLPARTEPSGDKRIPPRQLEADTFQAPPSVLAPLFREGSITTPMPHCDAGQLVSTGVRAFRPWISPEGIGEEPFDTLMVRCRLLKSIQLIPWLHPRIEVGETIAIPFSLVRAIGLYELPPMIQVLEPQQ